MRAPNYSDEPRATYVVSATDTSLAFRTETSDLDTAMAAYGDVFLGFATVEFTRDAGGSVTGMQFTTGRVRKVRFDRVRSLGSERHVEHARSHHPRPAGAGGERRGVERERAHRPARGERGERDGPGATEGLRAGAPPARRPDRERA